MYAWTLQSYLWLRAYWPCQLTDRLPDTGIVLVHRNALRAGLIPVSPSRLLVCMQGDLPPYPQAQLQLVQNPTQRGYFLPHWPQPGLIPRDRNRGDRFENLAFFGHQDNLTGLGTDWPQRLEKLGLRWQPRVSQNRWDASAGVHPRWHDYSDIDAVVAVRSWRRQDRWRTRSYGHKPATKLYNSWLAGVPAILGAEAAYRAERQSDWDYLEVQNPEDLWTALVRLKQDPDLRQGMVRQGQRRSPAVHPESVVQHWLAFFQQVALPAYDRWASRPLWRLVHGQRQWFSANLSRVDTKLRSALL